jgi:hypothetical protein
MISEILVTVINALVALASGAVLWLIRQSGETVIAGAKTAAEEGARTAIRNANWAVELRQEIEKSRGMERQEIRFKSYGSLWKKLRPLAIYSDQPMDRETFRTLLDNLTDWYFSERGGMFLLPHTRDFYFALQDFSRTVSSTDDWHCKRYDGQHREIFEKVLGRLDLKDAAKVRKELLASDLRKWPEGIEESGKLWRKDIQTLGNRWNDLDESERFAVIQQIGSVLRTNLANDVESRLR